MAKEPSFGFSLPPIRLTDQIVTADLGINTISDPTNYLDVVYGPASKLATALQADVNAGSIALDPPPGTPAAGKGGFLTTEDPVNVTLPAGYAGAFLGDRYGASTLYGSGSADQTILASDGGLLFGAYGAGSVVAGDGDDNIYIPASAGPWFVQLGNGNNAVLALAGADTLSGGSGTNLFYLGAGASSVKSNGADTIAGGSGTSTVTLGDPVPNGSSYENMAGRLVFAGSGGIDVVDNVGVDTVIGLSGSVTVTGGGDGGGQFYGGSAGHNIITLGLNPRSEAPGDKIVPADATIFGGGDGDVLSAQGRVLIGGGAGAETMSAGAGIATFYAGSGPDLLLGGSGTTAFVAGAGNDTLVADPKSRLNLFVFQLGRTGGNDLVQGFVGGRDFVAIQGFQGQPTGAVSYVLANATVAGGAETLRLPDGTQVTFAGVTNLAAESFI